MKKYPGLDCILLVDDDPPTNFIHQKIIQTTDVDAHVHACESGKSALAYLNGQAPFHDDVECPKPGIIFLDINMPGMDGWEFLEQYERLPEEKKQRVVVAMLTTSVNPADKILAENNSNVYSYFSKPLRRDYINQLVREKFSLG